MSSSASIISPTTIAAAPFLEVVGIRKSFGSVVALSGVSLDVRRGELFGLLGPNGAGKSTLLSIIAGLTVADAGSVKLGGRSVGLSTYDVRRHIGLAPQDIALYPELSAAENLHFFGRLYGLSKRTLREQIVAELRAVGLFDRRNSRVGGFSGGMKRRLNLAVAVLHRPDILFLDEPTAGVDPQSRNHIFQQVRRLNDEGMTIIYTSHYMEEVQLLCNRVAILDAGRIVCCDSVRQLLDLDESHIRMTHVTEEISAALPGLPGVVEVQAEHGRIALSTREPERTLTALLRLFDANGVSAPELELHRPTLERVFLRLTGHELRD